MSSLDEERRRTYPGDRFSRRIIEQDLDELADRLRNEEFSEGHLEQGHNQFELYRHNGTTVSMFVLDEGAHLPEHSVDDGSVMIQVVKGKIHLQTEDEEDQLHPDENSVVILEQGLGHTVQAEKLSRLLVTIIRG